MRKSGMLGCGRMERRLCAESSLKRGIVEAFMAASTSFCAMPA